MSAGIVDQIVTLYREALAPVELPDGTAAQDVTYALEKLKREWVMPEKTHATGSTPPPTLPGGGGGGDIAAITSVEPASTEVGVAVDITVTGTGFTEESVVSADGNALITTFSSATQLTASVPGPLAAGTVALTVDGSEPYSFEVTAPAGRRTRA